MPSETFSMSPAKKLNLVAVEDYLAGELLSPIKHEYIYIQSCNSPPLLTFGVLLNTFG